MSIRSLLFGRSARLAGTALALSGTLLVPSAQSSVTPPSPEPVIRVEEDWVLVLNEPDNRVESPQFFTVMSPFGHLDSYFAEVIWNYRENPDFTPGGLQLQSFEGDRRLLRRSVGTAQLSTSAETITWTQAMATDGSSLAIQILDGQSETWGAFGKDMIISVDAYLPYLDEYDTNVSAQNSCVTFGSNRVDSLTITQVRRYGSSGLLSVDTTPKTVYELVDE